MLRGVSRDVQRCSNTSRRYSKMFRGFQRSDVFKNIFKYFRTPVRGPVLFKRFRAHHGPSPAWTSQLPSRAQCWLNVSAPFMGLGLFERFSAHRWPSLVWTFQRVSGAQCFERFSAHRRPSLVWTLQRPSRAQSCLNVYVTFVLQISISDGRRKWSHVK